MSTPITVDDAWAAAKAATVVLENRHDVSLTEIAYTFNSLFTHLYGRAVVGYDNRERIVRCGAVELAREPKERT